MVHSRNKIRFRPADKATESEQIFQLNHAIFAVEIGQHLANTECLLVDKFHDKNSYFVAEDAGRIVGLICAHSQPPYSVEEKCPGCCDQLAPDLAIGEVRLLAVHADYRYSHVAWGLILEVADYLGREEIDCVVISGIIEKKRMYERLGFRTLGPSVSRGRATFVPMVVNKHEFVKRNAKMLRRFRQKQSSTPDAE